MDFSNNNNIAPEIQQKTIKFSFTPKSHSFPGTFEAIYSGRINNMFISL